MRVELAAAEALDEPGGFLHAAPLPDALLQGGLQRLHVAVGPLGVKVVCFAQVVEGLCAEGIEVVVDDRDERPGFKFADNDLMGFPYQVVLGKRGLKNGTVELKDRATGEREDVAIDEVVAKVAELVKAARR